jgi:DNA-binding CsgD family transcriptional regulator
MASSREPADVTPATGVQAARGEHWWPVALAIVVAAFLHVALPAKYRINPPWVAPAVLLGLLAALIIGDPGRIDQQKTWLRILTGAMIACLTLANLAAAGRLVHDIITSNKLYTLSLGFCKATAFSPTDISAIRPWAKLMMITEAAVSVVIGALAAAAALRAAADAGDGHEPLLAEVRTLAQRSHILLQPPEAGTAERGLPEQGSAPYGLTGRELAVLRLLAAGRTNTQIGAELYISHKTASVHVSNILRKLGVSGRAQAAAVAERGGLLTASDPKARSAGI